MLVSNGLDTRLLVVFGYARLVGYDAELHLVPDILEEVEVEDGRFTDSSRAGTVGRMARRSPPRISATGGRTSPATSSSA